MCRFNWDHVSISLGSFKLRLCVDFVEIMCWSRRITQVEIVCQFCQNHVSASPRVHCSSSQIWKIFTEMENVERGTKTRKIEFLNSIRTLVDRHAQNIDTHRIDRPSDRPILTGKRNPIGLGSTFSVSPKVCVVNRLIDRIFGAVNWPVDWLSGQSGFWTWLEAEFGVSSPPYK